MQDPPDPDGWTWVDKREIRKPTLPGKQPEVILIREPLAEHPAMKRQHFGPVPPGLGLPGHPVKGHNTRRRKVFRLQGVRAMTKNTVNDEALEAMWEAHREAQEHGGDETVRASSGALVIDHKWIDGARPSNFERELAPAPRTMPDFGSEREQGPSVWGQAQRERGQGSHGNHAHSNATHRATSHEASQGVAPVDRTAGSLPDPAQHEPSAVRHTPQQEMPGTAVKPLDNPDASTACSACCIS